ncbi:MAG: bifunctional diaminohydroxyphosphoribosylaminopyrimidine deaminase/5-amino-6-(5-phosphoribosylamino)uracil reductase RibD [Bdellovibrionales bacterium]|nr:bifunctional diaminohydroxyphosphoribosylaminopyrimidine deaminase/5-amino-6-(5-phosphoribosylamino)uracil reductase RibD [Bdellovibrionales bacterium]
MAKTYKKFDPITSREAQSLALREGYKGAGWVSPNPLVGCVIVDAEHRFLASGYHAKFGEAHAEVNALKNLNSDELRGGIMYVTLEPCSHHGKTPPCADRVAREPFKKVVVGVKDPNPLVSGRGLEILRKNKIQVEFDSEFSEKSKRLAEVFLWNIQTQMPFITLKLASSLDGKIALKNGESRWITSETSRRLGRVLRAHHDATLIGARTLLNDDPLLDFRDTAFEGRKKNKIVIYDPKGTASEFLRGSKLLKTHEPSSIFLLTSKVSPQLNVEQYFIESNAGISEDMLRWMYKQQIYSLYVEGGTFTFSQFLRNHSFQKLYQFMSPDILGDGISWTDSLHLENIQKRIPLEIHKIRRTDRDILMIAYPR